MTDDLINCGTCYVQKMHRVSIQKTCKMCGIEEGDKVEVWIKPVPKEDEKL